MKRIAIALVAAGAVFSVVFAAAASLGGLTSVDLGSDDSVVVSCDTDGLTIDYNVQFNDTAQAYELTGVQVSNIAPACFGGELSVTVTGEDVGGAGVDFVEGASPALLIATADGVPFNAGVRVEDIDDVHVLIEGP